jgi:hypothetical protein
MGKTCKNFESIRSFVLKQWFSAGVPSISEIYFNVYCTILQGVLSNCYSAKIGNMKG